MSLLDRIMALTTAIEECVAGTDWAGATDLDAERKVLLQAFFAGQPGAVGDGSSRAILEQLRARTNATLATVSATHAAVATTVRQLKAAPAAVRAYESNGSHHRMGEHAK